MEVLPVSIGQTDGGELPADLETSDEVGDGELGGVGGGEDVVEGGEEGLGEVLFGCKDEVIGSEVSGVLLLVGRVGEDDDFRAESLGELDGEVCNQWVCLERCR